MSTSYKAVFVLSILMILVVIIVGAMSGSKSVGFGIWYWGYTAWKMYKRDNDSLVSLQKAMLWFEAIAFSIGLAVLLFSDSDVRRYVDITLLGLIILATLSIGVTYLLYKFFKEQRFTDENSSVISNDINDPALWEQVSDELKSGKRVDSLWARAFSESDGDASKTNARYIKLRFSQIKLDSRASSNSSVSSSTKKSIKVKLTFFDFWDNFNIVGKVALIGILFLIGISIYQDYYSKNTAVKSFDLSKQAPAYRKLSDGTLIRWSGDKECFTHMNIDIIKSAIPISVSRTGEGKSSNFKELTQENVLITILYFDDKLNDEAVTKLLDKDMFLKIKSLCQ
jgi:hypothetical protein